MKTMRECAYGYEMKHKSKGMVVALEDYRFLFAEKPKDENSKSNSLDHALMVFRFIKSKGDFSSLLIFCKK